MAERIRSTLPLNHLTIEEFLSERLRKYLKDITALERSNLYDSVVSEVEKTLIKIVMEATEGNQVRAARTLGISRNTLREKLKIYKIGDSSVQHKGKKKR